MSQLNKFNRAEENSVNVRQLSEDRYYEQVKQKPNFLLAEAVIGNLREAYCQTISSAAGDNAESRHTAIETNVAALVYSKIEELWYLYQERENPTVKQNSDIAKQDYLKNITTPDIDSLSETNRAERQTFNHLVYDYFLLLGNFLAKKFVSGRDIETVLADKEKIGVIARDFIKTVAGNTQTPEVKQIEANLARLNKGLYDGVGRKAKARNQAMNGVLRRMDLAVNTQRIKGQGDPAQLIPILGIEGVTATLGESAVVPLALGALQLSPLESILVQHQCTSLLEGLEYNLIGGLGENTKYPNIRLDFSENGGVRLITDHDMAPTPTPGTVFHQAIEVVMTDILNVDSYPEAARPHLAAIQGNPGQNRIDLLDDLSRDYQEYMAYLAETKTSATTDQTRHFNQVLDLFRDQFGFREIAIKLDKITARPIKACTTAANHYLSCNISNDICLNIVIANNPQTGVGSPTILVEHRINNQYWVPVLELTHVNAANIPIRSEDPIENGEIVPDIIEQANTPGAVDSVKARLKAKLNTDFDEALLTTAAYGVLIIAQQVVDDIAANIKSSVLDVEIDDSGLAGYFNKIVYEGLLSKLGRIRGISSPDITQTFNRLVRLTLGRHISDLISDNPSELRYEEKFAIASLFGIPGEHLRSRISLEKQIAESVEQIAKMIPEPLRLKGKKNTLQRFAISPNQIDYVGWLFSGQESVSKDLPVMARQLARLNIEQLREEIAAMKNFNWNDSEQLQMDIVVRILSSTTILPHESGVKRLLASHHNIGALDDLIQRYGEPALVNILAKIKDVKPGLHQELQSKIALALHCIKESYTARLKAGGYGHNDSAIRMCKNVIQFYDAHMAVDNTAYMPQFLAVFEPYHPDNPAAFRAQQILTKDESLRQKPKSTKQIPEEFNLALVRLLEDYQLYKMLLEFDPADTTEAEYNQLVEIVISMSSRFINWEGVFDNNFLEGILIYYCQVDQNVKPELEEVLVSAAQANKLRTSMNIVFSLDLAKPILTGSGIDTDSLAESIGATKAGKIKFAHELLYPGFLRKQDKIWHSPSIEEEYAWYSNLILRLSLRGINEDPLGTLRRVIGSIETS